MAALMQQAIAARDREEFGSRVPFSTAFARRKAQIHSHSCSSSSHLQPTQSKHPDPLSALLRAREVLRPLDPERTLDPETSGLWGAIHNA